MRFPNKVTTFKESIFFLGLKILEYKNFKKIEINELYLLVEKEINIIEFKEALCFLYLIDRIDIKFTEGMVYYA